MTAIAAADDDYCEHMLRLQLRRVALRQEHADSLIDDADYNEVTAAMDQEQAAVEQSHLKIASQFGEMLDDYTRWSVSTRLEVKALLPSDESYVNAVFDSAGRKIDRVAMAIRDRRIRAAVVEAIRREEVYAAFRDRRNGKLSKEAFAVRLSELANITESIGPNPQFRAPELLLLAEFIRTSKRLSAR